MLKQEHAAEFTPLSYTSPAPSYAKPPQTEAVTPQELARAVVAVEDRQQSPLQTPAGSAALEQAIAQSGAAVTPDQLLAEVQRQRSQSHENQAMTPHLTQNPVVRLLIAGVVCSSAAALFLLFVSYTFAVRFRDANAALAPYVERQVRLNAAPSASSRLQSWQYAGAGNVAFGNGGNWASATMTTTDDYATVWRHYGERAGYKGSVQGVGMRGEAESTINMNAGGGAFENREAVTYNIVSNPTQTDSFAVFNQVGPFSTVTTTLTHHVGSPTTTINIMATKPDK